MVYLRATALVLAVLLFLCVTPLQWVALRRRWPLRLWLPVAFSRTLAALLRLDVVTQSAANHLSWLDILAVCSVEPVCFLAKREIGAWPVASTFARLQETVFVDRQRRRSIPGANAAMAQRMLAGRPMLLFPEATTSDGSTLSKDVVTQSAANHLSWLDILAVCSVEPVCFLAKREIGAWPVASTFARLQETVFVDRQRRRSIPGANAAMAQRMLAGRAIRYSTPAAAWFGDATLLPHLWSVLKGEPIRCDLVFGQPLAYARGENRKVITGHAASAIAGMLASMARAVEPDLAGRAKTPALDPLAANS